MESFKEKQLKKQVDRLFGNSPQAEEIKSIVIRANTVGYTQEEIDSYVKQKEEDLKAILDYFDQPNMETTESKTIYNKLFSNELLDNAESDRNESR